MSNSNLTPCRHLDYDGEYTDCTIETCAPYYPNVRFWRRGETWTGNGEPVKVQFCGAGRGRINGIFQCYQPGEMGCYAPGSEPAETGHRLRRWTSPPWNTGRSDAAGGANMQDRIKAIVSSALGLLALLAPQVANAIPQADIMQGVLGAYAAYHLVRLIIDQVHAAAVGAVMLALLLPGAAMAQEPTPASPEFGALLQLDTGEPGVQGLSGELDAALSGMPLSFVAHVGHGPMGVKGAVGPRLTHDFGPVSILGHYLYGAVGVGSDAISNTLHRVGGALDIDIGRRGFLRWGVNRDHAGMATWSGVVGVGVRF